MTEKPKKFKCELCEAEFNAPTALGMHKRTKHGILGKSSGAIAYRKAKEEHKASKAAGESGITEVKAKRAKWRKAKKKEREKIEEYGYEAASNKRRSKESDTLALITVGKIISICETTAQKHGVSSESFTKRVSELFYASQVW